MRWDSLRLTDDDTATSGPAPLLPRGSVTRRFDTPEFRGITFHEVTARSALNRVPEASRMPFRWTINPYRGCSHACIYCFARKTHEYLDLDSGHDFDSQIVVKTNVGEVLRRELRRPSWTGEHIAMGTNVDCYQRAEGRYRLMPDILARPERRGQPVLDPHQGRADPARPAAAASRPPRSTDVSAAVSVGCLDRRPLAPRRAGHAATAAPARRRAHAHRAGIRAGVLMAPILPYLTDSDEQLEATVAAIAATGATHVTPLVLHLRPGARDWWYAWLQREQPDLVPRYDDLYAGRAYAPKAYQQAITHKVRELADRYRVGRGAISWRRGPAPESPVTDPVRGTVPAAAAQLSLLDA